QAVGHWSHSISHHQGIGIVVKKYDDAQKPRGQLTRSGGFSPGGNNIHDALHTSIFGNDGHRSTDQHGKKNDGHMTTGSEGLQYIGVYGIHQPIQDTRRTMGENSQ